MGAGVWMTDVFKSPVTQACVCRVHFFGSVEPVMCVNGPLELVPQKGCSCASLEEIKVSWGCARMRPCAVVRMRAGEGVVGGVEGGKRAVPQPLRWELVVWR